MPSVYLLSLRFFYQSSKLPEKDALQYCQALIPRKHKHNHVSFQHFEYCYIKEVLSGPPKQCSLPWNWRYLLEDVKYKNLCIHRQKSFCLASQLQEHGCSLAPSLTNICTHLEVSRESLFPSPSHWNCNHLSKISQWLQHWSTSTFNSWSVGKVSLLINGVGTMPAGTKVFTALNLIPEY